jgi:hypothetical protein
MAKNRLSNTARGLPSKTVDHPRVGFRADARHRKVAADLDQGGAGGPHAPKNIPFEAGVHASRCRVTRSGFGPRQRRLSRGRFGNHRVGAPIGNRLLHPRGCVTVLCAGPSPRRMTRSASVCRRRSVRPLRRNWQLDERGKRECSRQARRSDAGILSLQKAGKPQRRFMRVAIERRAAQPDGHRQSGDAGSSPRLSFFGCCKSSLFGTLQFVGALHAGGSVDGSCVVKFSGCVWTIEEKLNLVTFDGP